jgi:hypothetical protein
LPPWPSLILQNLALIFWKGDFARFTSYAMSTLEVMNIIISVPPGGLPGGPGVHPVLFISETPSSVRPSAPSSKTTPWHA